MIISPLSPVKNVNVIIFIPLLVVHICIIIMINIKYVLYYLSSVASILISAYTIDIWCYRYQVSTIPIPILHVFMHAQLHVHIYTMAAHKFLCGSV